MWDLDISGKNILVTGGSSGIGLSVALEASRQGARIGIVGRNPTKLRDALNHLPGEGHQIYPWDLSNLETLESLGKKVAGTLGPLSGIVHAAGTYQARPFRIESVTATNDVFLTNFLAPTVLTKVLIQKAVRTPQISIVFLSSVSSLRGQSGASSYSASKGALNSLVRSLSAELGNGGVRVNSVIAGLVKTPLSQTIRESIGELGWNKLLAAHPLGIGKPEDVASSVLFLLSGKSRWITGTELVVDGGYLAC